MSWHPVALSIDLPPGRVTGARIAGHPVALWRDVQGRAHVWEDRCPHRGMRLSLGFVREGVLTCLYHGWRFGAEGSCRHIPAHPELAPPETIRAMMHRAAEAGGLIWASLDGEAAPPEPEPREGVRSVRVEAAPEAAAVALDTLPDPMAPGADSPPRPRRHERGVWRFGDAAVALLDGGQALTVLHGLVAPGASRDSRRALAAGLAALRRHLEGGQ